MIRFYVAFLLLLTHVSVNAQSKYGFTVGIDTAAQRLHLKSKTEYSIFYSDTLPDTSIIISRTYDPQGYISSYSPSEKTKVKFEYNTEGYLIEETGFFGIPQAIGGGYDSTVIERSETILYTGHQEFVLSEHTISKSSDYNWSSFFSKEYDSLGYCTSSKRMGISNGDTTYMNCTIHYDTTDRHAYTECHSTESGILIMESIYDHNNLVIERRHSENGKLWWRELIIYEYY